LASVDRDCGPITTLCLQNCQQHLDELQREVALRQEVATGLLDASAAKERRLETLNGQLDGLERQLREQVCAPLTHACEV
jgi:hypothetical protein